MVGQTGKDYAAIVIGTGIAGLTAALHAKKAGRVALVTKAAPEASNTSWAQGGLAAAMGDDDSPLLHFEDTVAAGAGLVDLEAARVVADESPAAIRDLEAAGIRFDTLDGSLALGMEAAHQRSRIVHAGGDRSGANLSEGLLRAIAGTDVEVIAGQTMSRLLVDGGKVRGVELLDAEGMRSTLPSRSVVLATGGAGQLYSHTTNPEVATGDGIAAAFEAGALLADLEFFQFHPTAFHMVGQPPSLISEAVRGEGAVLRTVDGRRFMPEYHALAELAPRDVVARAIRTEMVRGGTDHVVLDCRDLRHVDLAARFPWIHGFCLGAGIEMAQEPIPVAPAAHYFMGGVLTDIDGRTSIEGLYAVGEVACTGLHGANRLASNSLVEGAVFGRRAGEAIVADRDWRTVIPDGVISSSAGARAPGDIAKVQELMWSVAGIERDGPAMEQGLATMAAWAPAPEADSRATIERTNLALVARLVLDAANRRTESRGAHFRRDFPLRDDVNWQRRQVFQRGD